jgi:aminodeoxyfutalosine synthase
MDGILEIEKGMAAVENSLRFQDTSLAPLWEKIQGGERLTEEDGLALYRTPDLIGLGRMAHSVQKWKSGDAVSFVLNQKIEHTNVCVLSCKFCDFAAKKGDQRAYEWTTEEILSRLTPEIQEVHITGGMPADWPWERYLEMLRSIAERLPEADIKAFTAVEIDFFHKKFKKSLEDVLLELKAAGLKTMPGGGAEVFSERVRRALFNQKIGAKRWLEVHRIAHRLGIPTNSTMLYGHIETLEERLAHLVRLRELQDETRGFLTFVPLAFQPGETGIKPRQRFTSAVDDLKTIAVSRLMLDNFPHIKAYWVMLGEEVASVALNFGADDIDGTVGGEKIAHDAGATSPMTLAKERIIRIILDAGMIPVERDAFYNPLKVYAANVVGKIPYLNSVPFYERFSQREFRILPVVPRRMGLLSEQAGIDAGPFSLMDYLRQSDRLELMGWCIATRDQVKSVMLFSKEGWAGLQGKSIGITDDTATSVQLLRVLLARKHQVNAHLVRMHAGVNDLSGFGAVLLIGDEALRRNKHGLDGFELVYDLAREWYDWQKLPFVFAVWAMKSSLSPEVKTRLKDAVRMALDRLGGDYTGVGSRHGRQIGLTADETREYLEGFNYRLGEREKEAMRVFAGLYADVEEGAHTKENYHAAG